MSLARKRPRTRRGSGSRSLRRAWESTRLRSSRRSRSGRVTEELQVRSRRLWRRSSSLTSFRSCSHQRSQALHQVRTTEWGTRYAYRQPGWTHRSFDLVVVLSRGLEEVPCGKGRGQVVGVRWHMMSMPGTKIKFPPLVCLGAGRCILALERKR